MSYKIINFDIPYHTTGRRESNREITIKQLQEAGIFYDQLIMGIGGDPRILINDNKTTGIEATSHICLTRNEGIKNINICYHTLKRQI
jgi:hypothetical protein